MQCVWDKSEQNVMNIDINDIKSFITVAELKSISGAAHKLNYLQHWQFCAELNFCNGISVLTFCILIILFKRWVLNFRHVSRSTINIHKKSRKPLPLFAFRIHYFCQ